MTSAVHRARYNEDSGFTAEKNFCGEKYRNFKYRYIGMKSGNPDRGGKIDKKQLYEQRGLQLP